MDTGDIMRCCNVLSAAGSPLGSYHSKCGWWACRSFTITGTCWKEAISGLSPDLSDEEPAFNKVPKCFVSTLQFIEVLVRESISI